MKYNRATIKLTPESRPVIQDIIDKSGVEDTEHWMIHSKESFHGEHDEKFFHFKDSRIETGTKLPLSCVELEFSEEELLQRS